MDFNCRVCGYSSYTKLPMGKMYFCDHCSSMFTNPEAFSLNNNDKENNEDNEDNLKNECDSNM